MGRVLIVYAFKLRQFFGPVRRSPAAGILLGVSAALLLPVVFLVGYFIPDTPLWTSPRLAELFAAGLSTFLAFDLLFALSGGTLTHGSEIEFFATAPLRPREYLLADLLFQFTVTDALAVPLMGVAALGISARLGIWFASFGAIAAFLGFAAMGLALGQFMGLMISSRRRGAKVALVALILLVMFPAAHTIAPAFPGYAEFPLPSSAAAYLIVGLLRGGSIGVPAFVLVLGGVVIAAAWVVRSRGDVFPYLRPTMRVAFGQMDMQRAAIQAQALTRGLSRLTSRVSVDLHRGSPLSMMTRLHLLRIVRDGSILMIGIMTGVVLLIGFANRVEGGAAPSDLNVLSAGWVGLLIPLILSYNWNATERPNLWAVAVASRHLSTYVRGLYRALLVVTGTIAILGALTSGAATALGGLAAVLMALGSCGAAVVAVTALRIPADAFSLRSAVPFLLVPIVSIGVGAPVVAMAVLVPALGLPEAVGWPPALAYGAAILVIFDRLAIWASRRIEL